MDEQWFNETSILSGPVAAHWYSDKCLWRVLGCFWSLGFTQNIFILVHCVKCFRGDPNHFPNLFLYSEVQMISSQDPFLWDLIPFKSKQHSE